MLAVITDGYTLNPGDLDWNELKTGGVVYEIYERTSPQQVLERCQHADIVLTNKVPFARNLLEQLPKLKLISVTATGHNIIDGKAAKERGIAVCNVPSYGTASVAQHAIALMLALSNQLLLHANAVAAGEWLHSPDWSYGKAPLMELEGKVMGIVGWGNIGRRTAGIAAALGMQILYFSPRPIENSLGTYAALEELFAKSDVVSLHCPLTEENKEFVNRHLLATMKPHSFLINTSRGQLICEQDLADALNGGIIAGAAMDVLSTEPPTASNPLLSAKNCIITPHIAWVTTEARKRIMDITRKNIEAFLLGKLINVING